MGLIEKIAGDLGAKPCVTIEGVTQTFRAAGLAWRPMRQEDLWKPVVARLLWGRIVKGKVWKDGDNYPLYVTNDCGNHYAADIIGIIPLSVLADLPVMEAESV